MYVSSSIAEEVLSAVKKEFAPQWLFVLGAYHTSRHALFDDHGVFGSDYKGWIFNYEHRRDRIARIHADLSEIEQNEPKVRQLLDMTTERERLAKLEYKHRLNYIRTKNDTEDNETKKALIRRKLSKVSNNLSDADRRLLAARQDLASKNGLPRTYKKAVADMALAVRMSDQQVRVGGVHEYLVNHVYSQMRGPVYCGSGFTKSER
jgi:hypothetical protein